MNVDLRALYETARWRRARAAFLRLNPFCRWPGCGKLATIVDHIVPRSTARTDAELQLLTWDRGNWQGLCKPHHDEKTRGEQARKRPVIVDQPATSAIVRRDYSRSPA